MEDGKLNHRSGRARAPTAKVKPLYWTVADGRLQFASEIKALLIDQRGWLRGPLEDALEETFASRRFRERPWFEPTALDALLAAAREGRGSPELLWRPFAVERWLRLLVDPLRLEIEPGPAPDRPAQVTQLEQTVAVG